MSRLIKQNGNQIFIDFSDNSEEEELDLEKAIKEIDLENDEDINFKFSQSSTEIFDNDDEKELTKSSEKTEDQSDSTISQIRYKFQVKFLKLAQEHRREATSLKNQWISYHQKTEKLTKKKIDELIFTSKVLASCECFDAAKDLRDRTTQNESSFIQNSFLDSDKHFREAFKAMIERHRVEYEAMYSEMNQQIRLNEHSFVQSSDQ